MCFEYVSDMKHGGDMATPARGTPAWGFRASQESTTNGTRHTGKGNKKEIEKSKEYTIHERL